MRSIESKVVHTTFAEIGVSVCAKRVPCSGTVACPGSGVESPRGATLSKKSSKSCLEGVPTQKSLNTTKSDDLARNREKCLFFEKNGGGHPKVAV